MIDTCKRCGKEDRQQFTAPAGGLVCGQCNDFLKHLMLARYQGVTDDQLKGHPRHG